MVRLLLLRLIVRKPIMMRDHNIKDILFRKLNFLFPNEKDRDEVISILNEYGKE